MSDLTLSPTISAADLNAACVNCGPFAVTRRDVFGAGAVFCPTCTDRGELLADPAALTPAA